MIRMVEDSITGQLDKLLGYFGKPINTMVAEEAKKNIENHFDESQGPDGKWKPISPVTAKIRKSTSNKPLVNTGKLKKSGKVTATEDSAIIEFSRTTNEGQEVAETLNSGGIIKKSIFGKTVNVEVEAREFGYLNKAGISNIEAIPDSVVRKIQ